MIFAATGQSERERREPKKGRVISTGPFQEAKDRDRRKQGEGEVDQCSRGLVDCQRATQEKQRGRGCMRLPPLPPGEPADDAARDHIAEQVEELRKSHAGPGERRDVGHQRQGGHHTAPVVGRKAGTMRSN